MPRSRSAERSEWKRRLDAAYTERNCCVSLAARMAIALGYRTGIRCDPAEEPGWQHIIYLDLPAGQVSWHIPDRELPFFSFLPSYPAPWDGHTTDEKYARVLSALEVAADGEIPDRQSIPGSR